MAAKRRIMRVITIAVVVIILVLALYIILTRRGVVPEYDFGAGAYYYADIPTEQYQEIDPDGAYRTSVPKWVFYVLFVGWGWLMWRLWCRISRAE
jgi:peptidoglycan/LPS O-acetylase OafA/YrhL